MGRRGRPAIFDKAMTAAERQRRSRALRKAGTAKPATRREQAEHAGITERAWLYRLRRSRDRAAEPFTFARIDHKTSRPFVARHHYAGNVPTGMAVHFGAFIGDELYAVAIFGAGANADGGRALARMTGLPVTRSNHMTLLRLCRRGRKFKSRIAMTSFLAQCHRTLKREHGVRFIVSYADPVMNGTATPTPASKPWAAGGIYAAANYTYLGKVPPERHFRDHTGRFVHRRVPYRLMKRQQAAGKHMTMADAVRERGLTPWRMPPKERWFIDLGKHSVVASSRRG